LREFSRLRADLANQIITTEGFSRELSALLADLDSVLASSIANIQRQGMSAHQTAWAAGEAAAESVLEIGSQIPGGVHFPDFLEPAPRPGFLIRAPTSAQVLEEVHRAFTFERIVQVTAEMQAAIRQEVILARLGNLSVTDAMARITNIHGIRSQWDFARLGTTRISAKGERILRTELMRAQSLSKHDRFMESEANNPGFLHTWLATGDDRTRESHIDAHGQTLPLAEPFVVGAGVGMHPHDVNLPISEVANCRCVEQVYRPEWGPREEIFGPLDDQVEAERERRAAEGIRVFYRGWRMIERRERVPSR
jgi:hypothetical protein